MCCTASQNKSLPRRLICSLHDYTAGRKKRKKKTVESYRNKCALMIRINRNNYTNSLKWHCGNLCFLITVIHILHLFFRNKNMESNLSAMLIASIMVFSIWWQIMWISVHVNQTLQCESVSLSTKHYNVNQCPCQPSTAMWISVLVDQPLQCESVCMSTKYSYDKNIFLVNLSNSSWQKYIFCPSNCAFIGCNCAFIMAWYQIGDKPLSEPLLTWFTGTYMQH